MYIHTSNFSNAFRIFSSIGLTVDEGQVLLSINRGMPFGDGFKSDFESLVEKEFAVEIDGTYYLTRIASRVLADIKAETFRTCTKQPVNFRPLLQLR